MSASDSSRSCVYGNIGRLMRVRRRKALQLVGDVRRPLAGQARVLALLAALAQLTVAGRAGGVDLLAALQVLRLAQSAAAAGRRQATGPGLSWHRACAARHATRCLESGQGSASGVRSAAPSRSRTGWPLSGVANVLAPAAWRPPAAHGRCCTGSGPCAPTLRCRPGASRRPWAPSSWRPSGAVAVQALVVGDRDLVEVVDRMRHQRRLLPERALDRGTTSPGALAGVELGRFRAPGPRWRCIGSAQGGHAGELAQPHKVAAKAAARRCGSAFMVSSFHRVLGATAGGAATVWRCQRVPKANTSLEHTSMQRRAVRALRRLDHGAGAVDGLQGGLDDQGLGAHGVAVGAVVAGLAARGVMRSTLARPGRL
jgi:hypothetical protein